MAELKQGGESAYTLYDQYDLRKRKPVHETVLQPIRNLLDIGYSGSGVFYANHNFRQLDRSSDGDNLIVLESPNEGGARVWCASDHPYLIHKMEFLFMDSQRYGHIEYIFEYDSGKDSASEGAVDVHGRFPSGWEISVFDPDGTMSAKMNCKVESISVNDPVPDDKFEIRPPAGAIIFDEFESVSQYYLQLADGKRRKLDLSQMGFESLLRLSSSVPGSRVEGVVARPVVRESKLKYLLLINILVVVFVVAVLLLRKYRKDKSF